MLCCAGRGKSPRQAPAAQAEFAIAVKGSHGVLAIHCTTLAHATTLVRLSVPVPAELIPRLHCSGAVGTELSIPEVNALPEVNAFPEVNALPEVNGFREVNGFPAGNAFRERKRADVAARRR